MKMLTGTYEQHRIFDHSGVKGDINEFSPFANKSVQDRNKHMCLSLIQSLKTT